MRAAMRSIDAMEDDDDSDEYSLVSGSLDSTPGVVAGTPGASSVTSGRSSAPTDRSEDTDESGPEPPVSGHGPSAKHGKVSFSAHAGAVTQVGRSSAPSNAVEGSAPELPHSGHGPCAESRDLRGGTQALGGMDLVDKAQCGTLCGRSSHLSSSLELRVVSSAVASAQR